MYWKMIVMRLWPIFIQFFHHYKKVTAISVCKSTDSHSEILYGYGLYTNKIQNIASAKHICYGLQRLAFFELLKFWRDVPSDRSRGDISTQSMTHRPDKVFSCVLCLSLWHDLFECNTSVYFIVYIILLIFLL